MMMLMKDKSGNRRECHELVHHAAIQERNDREAAAEDEGPRLAEEERDLGEHRLVQRRCDAAGGGYVIAEGEDHCIATLGNPFLWRRPDEPYEQAGDEKDPDDLGLGDDGDRCGDDIDPPRAACLCRCSLSSACRRWRR